MPLAVRAALYYQATPPFFLQDRFCTARGADTQRLYFLAGHLNLDGTQAADDHGRLGFFCEIITFQVSFAIQINREKPMDS